MAATFKSGEFSNNNDYTYGACGIGVSPFAVPVLSQKVAYDDNIDKQAYESATHKTQAESRKHLLGHKCAPPKTLREVIQVLNNYICWLEVMFGSNCPHLRAVVRLRDVLDIGEERLECIPTTHQL